MVKPAIQKRSAIGHIQKQIFITQFVLILTLAIFLGVTGTLVNINFETKKRDRNLQNVAETIAHSPLMDDMIHTDNTGKDSSVLIEYLDSLKNSLEDIDVISVVSTADNVRLYHSNHALIGSAYDGTLPEFHKGTKDFYTASDKGPSGTQRRAYAAVYDEEGRYVGFVMAIMLMKNIRAETSQTLSIFAIITLTTIFIELFLSFRLSDNIKKMLHGYEPDVFSAMYQIRDNILESLDEGVIAIDRAGTVQFVNHAAATMLESKKNAAKLAGRPLSELCDASIFAHTLDTGEKQFNIQEPRLHHSDILLDRIPIRQDQEIVGAIGILHNRAEYTKLMEDLTGTQYLVDSMRANNHDFTNKLHVILGLIQMEMYEEATAYIENITMVQRASISKVMSAVDDPAVAALLIGKNARASEINARFILREGSSFAKSDSFIPSETLVTIIGNLIDNAFDAMNTEAETYDRQKELLFGIYSKPGALLITADDTGTGIPEEDLEKIFENGYSTKGEGRGTGLYQVKSMVEGLGGTITVQSQPGVGTSFSVHFAK